MKYLKVGHYTSTEHATGVSVFLLGHPAVGVYHICGSSPATRDLHVLDLDTNIENLNALVFTGGSAFGLSAAEGVMQFLVETGQGKRMPHGLVPIVPVAAIYDLAVKTAIPPTAEHAYMACQAADENNASMGRVGAGTGASVGKLVPNSSRMSGGIGYAEQKLEKGLIVSAYAVVNAVGDIYNAGGEIIAGAQFPDGEFANCFNYLVSGGTEPQISDSNTTLVAVFINAKFSKTELKRIAKMAVAGMAIAISPAFTRYDGDIIFCVSMGEHLASELTIGTIAAKVVRQAIVNAVTDSRIIDVN